MCFLAGDDHYKTAYAYDYHFATVWFLITFSSVRFSLKTNIENEINKCRRKVIIDFQNNADV